MKTQLLPAVLVAIGLLGADMALAGRFIDPAPGQPWSHANFPVAIPNECPELRETLGPDYVWVGKFSGSVRDFERNESASRWACFRSLRECRHWLGRMNGAYPGRIWVSRCERGAVGRSVWW